MKNYKRKRKKVFLWLKKKSQTKYLHKDVTQVIRLVDSIKDPTKTVKPFIVLEDRETDGEVLMDKSMGLFL